MRKLLGLLVVGLLIAVGGISALGALYTPQRDAPAGLQGKYIDVLGVRTRYVQEGTGPDVLLIHGSTGSLEDWADVAKALAPNFRVTIYDRPGHGYTESAGRYDYAFNADLGLALMQALRLKNVIVAGHSYGGATAVAMAMRNPPELRSIVVVDSAVYRVALKPDPTYRLLAIPGLGTGIARLAEKSAAPKSIRKNVEALGPVPAGYVESRIPMWAQPKVLVAVAHERLGAQAELDGMSKGYAAIGTPAFVVAQGDDPVPPRQRRAPAQGHRRVSTKTSGRRRAFHPDPAARGSRGPHPPSRAGSLATTLREQARRCRRPRRC